jgi:hypothetical protein
MVVNTSLDFRTDTPPGKDPDTFSPTLRQYHKHLWSKTLPSGARFDPTDSRPGAYLHHYSELGEFFLSSDSAIPTFTRWGFAAAHPDLVSDEENKAFMAVACTIGGMMVFPGNRLDGKWTINQARGCLRTISDRLDLTLECIRRHYLDESSPLAGTLKRYSAFVALFENFRGYVEFFLLQDLVNQDGSAVLVFPPFDDVKTRAVPADLDTYREYRRCTIDFVQTRNRRIERYTGASL